MTATMTRERATDRTVQHYRCAGVNGCGKTGPWPQIELHFTREKKAVRIEAVLDDDTRGTTRAGTGELPRGANRRSSGTAGSGSGEGPGPATTAERPSDDARAPYQPQKPKRRVSRARTSRPMPGQVPPVFTKPAKPTPEERRRSERLIEQAKKAARGNAS